MQIIQAPRASTILYNVLVACKENLPWLLPANICPIVPIAFLKARIPFELIDISAATLHLDLDQVEGRLKRTRCGGILYAHTYGDPSTPEVFFARVKARHPELIVVDDRCLCVPDLEARESSADVLLYSTGYAKIVELNFGGYAFIKDDMPYQAMRLPFDPTQHEELEREYKQALSRRAKFVYRDSNWLETERSLPAWYDYRQQIESGLKSSLEGRAALNQIYAARLPDEIQLPREYQTWRFNIRLKDKQKILDAIFRAGLFASSHYASLAGIMAHGNAPRAERLADHVINLFNDHHFTLQMAEQTCDIILENIS